MIRISMVVGLVFILSGCETFFLGAENTCGGRGHKNVRIEYGDGKLDVDPVVRVKKKKELRFMLHPAHNSKLSFDYETAEVETEGKTSDDDWLNASGTWKANRYLKVCVKEDQEETNYDYSVTVTDASTSKVISKIDPRIIVEPD